MPNDKTSISLSKELLNRIKARKHPGQSTQGVITETLDTLEKLEKEKGIAPPFLKPTDTKCPPDTPR